MRSIRRGSSIAVIGVTSLALLVVAIMSGLNIPGLGWLSPLPRSGTLDYSAGPPGGFAPLDPHLVSALLGPDEARGSHPTPAAPSHPPPVHAEPPPPVPILVSHAFHNDDFAHAYPIASTPFTAKTNTRSATRQPGEPPPCGALPGGKSAWYSFVSDRDVGLLADTFGSSYSTALTVFEGITLTHLRRTADCSSDPEGNAIVAFAARAGTRYFFQIDGPIGGDLVFSLQPQGVTSLVSTGPDGKPGDGDSLVPVLAGNGASVAFVTGASTLSKQETTCAPGGIWTAPCGRMMTYLRSARKQFPDRITPNVPGPIPGTSLGSIVAPGSVSFDGRYVVIWAAVQVHAPAGSTNSAPAAPFRFEVFRRDNWTGRVERVSQKCGGCPGTDTDGSSARGEISADGRYIAFLSEATNLVRDSRDGGPDTNGARDIFIRDMKNGRTMRVNLPNDIDRSALGREPNAEPSTEGPEFEVGADLLAISNNGRYIEFEDTSSNLVRHDHNAAADVFVRDLVEHTTTRVNVASDGTEADAGSKSVIAFGLGTITDDGRFAVFNSDASNLVSGTTSHVENVYRRNLLAKRTELVTTGYEGPANRGVAATSTRWLALSVVPTLVIARDNLSPIGYAMSADGRYIAFNSDADNLVPGDTNQSTDVFVRDMATRTTARVSVRSDGVESKTSCNAPSISDNGRFVAFDCEASAALVDEDVNQAADVFVRELPGARAPSGWYQ